MPRYDVFLSHAGADKPAVERLALRLRDAGVAPFFDQWDLVPGERWIQELGEALAQSDTLAVFVGPKSGGGAWRTREVELALAREARGGAFRIIPVLLPGGDERAVEEISGFLGLLTWVDFRAGLDDEGAFRRLLAGIRGEAPGPGPGGGGVRSYRCMAPAREPFVQRGEYAKVRDALLVDGTGAPGRATTVGITTAIHGGGGFGKTSLAVEICNDEQIRERYPDGILWVQMGDTLNDDGRLKEIRDVFRLWSGEEPPAFETVAKAGQHLIESLKGRRVLLVVDDVWRPEDVTPFQGLGPRAALLLTTRDHRTLPTESVPVHVDAMEVPEAVRMLGAGFPEERGVDLRSLAIRLGEWPLLLKIVNRQLRELVQKDGLSLEQALREVNEALDAEGLTVFDRDDLESRGQAVARTIGASLRRLSEEEVGRFEQLAIFPEDKNIPLRVLEKLWDLGSFATKKLCGRLHDLSLLLRFDRQTGTIRLHDVIRAYLRKRGEDRLSKWHIQLLDGFRPGEGEWPDLPLEESYLWDHLFHHLIGAGEREVCRNLLLNLRYLQARLKATDINGLLSDYSYLVEDRQIIRVVRDALRLSAHVLERNQWELLGQLQGRLMDREEVGIKQLLDPRSESGQCGHWLRIRKASLVRPGGALIRSIEHPGVPAALVRLPEGQVASVTGGGMMLVWDVENGQILRTLRSHVQSPRILELFDPVLGIRWKVSGEYNENLDVTLYERGGRGYRTLRGHSGPILALAALNSHMVVSGSRDKTLRVWDIRSGQLLKTLVGHLEEVTAVAVFDDGRIVSGSRDRTLRVWDITDGRTLQILAGHSGAVVAIAVLDRERVISGSLDETLKVWDVASGQTHPILEGHSERVSGLVVMDNCQVVSGSADGTIQVWEVESGHTLGSLGATTYGVTALAALDHRHVVFGSSDGALRVFDSKSCAVVQALEGHSGSIRAVAVLDSVRVVSGSSDGTLTVWDMKSGKALESFYPREHLHLDVDALSALGGNLVISLHSDQTVRVWDVGKGQRIGRIGGAKAYGAMVVLDSRRVVVGSSAGPLRVLDLESRKTLLDLKGRPRGISTLALLDGRRVVSGSWDRTIQIWDLDAGEVECQFTLEAPVTALAVIPDRRIIVAGDSLGRIHFFDFVES